MTSRAWGSDEAGRRSGAHQRSSVPRARELYWPTLLALRAFGGRPAPKSQVVGCVVHDLRLPGSVARILHRQDGSSTETELEYRLAWALTRLKKIGAADNPTLGRWVVTEFGRTIEDEQRLHELSDAHQRRHRSGPGIVSKTRKTLSDWVLESMRMLADAGVAEPSLDRIEHAAKALGWNGNSRSLRSAAWVAERDGHLRVAGHGRYRLREAARSGSRAYPGIESPPGPPAESVAGMPDERLTEMPSEGPGGLPTREPTTRDALVECVGRLAYVVEELKDAVVGLARK